MATALAPVPVHMERPEQMPQGKFVLIEKTGSNNTDRVTNAVIAIQSYGRTLYEACELNETVKNAILGTDLTAGIAGLGTVYGAKLNTDYNFTDTAEKLYRYQAVFDITF